ncbi:MAG: hypothetical protein MUE42_09910 [Opitutaceae bacterium]|jgi:hypothetical protein|nr:hypothetical protein [Opitutaceae bacterium]
MLRFTLSTDANPETPAFYPAGVELYLRDREVVLVPVPAPEGARTESAPHGFQVSLPAGLLSPGAYAFHLAGARESLRWTLLVR